MPLKNIRMLAERLKKPYGPLQGALRSTSRVLTEHVQKPCRRLAGGLLNHVRNVIEPEPSAAGRLVCTSPRELQHGAVTPL